MRIFETILQIVALLNGWKGAWNSAWKFVQGLCVGKG